MKIEKMRSRITIQKHQTIIDSIGNHTSGWADYYTCYSYANLTSANEHGVNPETVSERSVTFLVRWCKRLASINSKEYRIQFSGDVYNITGIDDVQHRHEKIRLLAEREVRGHVKEDQTGNALG